MKPKLLSTRLAPDSTAAIPASSGDITGQPIIAALLIFVAIAAFSAATTTQVDALLKKLYLGEQKLRHASGKLADIEDLVGTVGAGTVAHLRRVEEFKTGYERELVSNLDTGKLEWETPKEKVATMTQAERTAKAGEVMESHVAAKIKLPREDLSRGTRELIAQKAGAVAGELARRSFEDHLKGTTFARLNWGDIRPEAPQSPRQKLHEATRAQASHFTDWEKVPGADGEVEKRVSSLLEEEMNRLNREDNGLAKQIADFNVNPAAMPQFQDAMANDGQMNALVQDRVRQGAKLGDASHWGPKTREAHQAKVAELLSVFTASVDEQYIARLKTVSDLPKLDDRRQEEKLRQDTRAALVKALGLEAGGTWARRLPRTTAMIDERVNEHCGRMKSDRAIAVGRIVAEFRIKDSPEVIEAVRDLANSPPGGAKMPMTSQKVVEAAFDEIKVPDLQTEDRNKLTQSVATQLHAKKEELLKNLGSWVDTTPIDLPASPGATQETLVKHAAETIITSVSKAHPEIKGITAAEALALAHARKAVEKRLTDVQTALGGYVSRKLRDAMGPLTAEDVTPQNLAGTGERLARRFFPIKEKLPGLNGVRWEDLNDGQRTELQKQVGESLLSVQEQKARDAFKLLDSSKIKAIADARLDSVLNESASQKVAADARAELQVRAGAAWDLPDVAQYGAELIKTRLDEKRQQLQSNAFRPQLEKITKLNVTAEFFRRPDAQQAAVTMVVEEVARELQMPPEKIGGDLRKQAAEHAAGLLERRGAELAQEQIKALRAVVGKVDLSPFNTETVNQFQQRWENVVAEAAGIDPQALLPEARVELARVLEPTAKTRINEIAALLKEREGMQRRLLPHIGSTAPVAVKNDAEVAGLAPIATGPSQAGPSQAGPPQTAEQIREEIKSFKTTVNYNEAKPKIAGVWREIESNANLWPEEWFRNMFRHELEAELAGPKSERVEKLTNDILRAAKVAQLSEADASGSIRAEARRTAESLYKQRIEKLIQLKESERKEDTQIWRASSGVREHFRKYFETDRHGVWLDDATMEAMVREYGEKHIAEWKTMGDKSRNNWMEQLTRQTKYQRDSLRDETVSRVSKIPFETTEQHKDFPAVEKLIAQYLGPLPSEEKQRLEKAIIDKFEGMLKEIEEGQESLAPGTFSTFHKGFADRARKNFEFFRGRQAENGTLAAGRKAPVTPAPALPGVASATPLPATPAQTAYNNGQAVPRAVPVTPRVRPSPTPVPMAPVPSEFDLVLSFIQPDPKSSRTDVILAWHSKDGFVPFKGGARELGMKVVLGEANEERFAVFAKAVRAWLNDPKGLSEAIDQVRLANPRAVSPTFNIHLRTAGSMMPVELGVPVENSINEVAKNFPGIKIVYASWTTWDDKCKNPKRTIKGGDDYPKTAQP